MIKNKDDDSYYKVMIICKDQKLQLCMSIHNSYKYKIDENGFY